MLPPPRRRSQRQLFSGRRAAGSTAWQKVLRTVTGSPTAPASRRALRARCAGWWRNLNASASNTPPSRAAATSASASAAVVVNGFSQSTARTRPERARRMPVSAWVTPQVETTAMSGDSAASRRSREG